MLTELKEALQLKKGIRQRIESEYEAKEKKLTELNDNLVTYEKARIILQLVAKQTQEQLEYKISELVSLGLSAIFENPYELVLQYEIKRGKTEAELLFKREGNIYKPMLSSGGGAIDVASLCLRIAIWSLQTGRKRNTIVLDEPTKHLSKGKKEYRDKLGLLLSEISKKLSLQIIVVTHDEAIAKSADKSFLVEKNWETGISNIREYG